MITPQQIEQISFRHATFGGYDVQAVDEVLGPLTEDYVTLYNENSLLKSKMRILVSKLEEYRNNEAAIKAAIADSQKSCETMIRETELKCAQMLTDANEQAEEVARQAEAAMAAEMARVEEARQIANERIDRITRELNACVQILEKVRAAQGSGASSEAAYEPEQEDDITAAVADEIAHNLENLVGPAETPVPDSTSKFVGLSDHFGQNYDPTDKK